MSRLVAAPRAVPATVPATASPRARQATPRQPVRAGVPVYLQRVPADSPARARIAEQVQSQAQRADATTVQQASQAMAGSAGPAIASGALATGSGLGGGAATATIASAPGATAAQPPPAPGATAGRPQAGAATTDAQAPGATADPPAPGATPLQDISGSAGAGASAAEVTSAEGAGQAGSEGGVEAAGAGEGAPAAEGTGAQAGAGEGVEEAAAGPAGAGSGGPAGRASTGMADGEATAAEGVASADTGAGELATGDLVLIDVELAEHERWAGALGRVGEVASVERAGFIAEQVGSGFIGGAASGAAMGLGIGLVTRVVPAIGPAIGGAMALHGLVTRDWAATGATIGRFGEGNDTYEMLANTLASVSAVIDIVSGVLSVINGIVGVVQLAAIGIAVGATVLAFVTFGATAGVAIAAGELAVVCEEITVAINIVSGALDMVNAAVLSPCITLFRALHSFTADADPRETEANGADISSAAAASGAALGAWAGGRAAAARPRGGREEAPAPTRRPAHEAPPAAAGDGPVVRYTPAVEALPGGTPHAASGALDIPAPSSAGRPAPSRPATVEEIAASPGHRITDTAAPTEAAPAARPTADVEGPSRVREAAEAQGLDPRQAEIAETMAEAQRLASGAPLGQPELGNLPGPPGSHLRRGERDPGNYQVPPAARSRVGRSARREGLDELAEAVASGTDTPRTAAARDTITPDRLLELTDPEVRAADPERARDAERAVEASHVPAVAAEPHEAHTAANVEILPTEVHREGIHGGDTTRPLETARPNPDFEGRPGFHPLPERKSPNPRSDAGLLRDTARDAADLEANFPGARAETLAEGRQWLEARRAELRASGREDFDTPRRVTEEPQLVGEGSTRSEAPLTDAQYQQGQAMAVEMGMPADAVHRASGDTSYHPGYDALLLGPDLHPRPVGERPTGGPNPANAALEPRAVIGHEVIGHREAALGGQTRDEGWHEELQASVRAALHTPDLPPDQVRLLTADAAARRRFQQREGEIYVDTERYGPSASAPVRTPRPPDAEPSVIIDRNALGLPGRAAEAVEPRGPTATAAAAGRPDRPAQAAAPVAAGSWVSAAREGREATQDRIRASATGDGEAATASAPSAATGAAPGAAQAVAAPVAGPSRAHQVGALLLPQLFGPDGPAPSYAEQRAAHRARFSADNQPAEGVERVNPHYNAPPATPAQILEIQNQILNLLSVRGLAEQEAEHQADRAAACEENAGPIAATVADTAASQSALAEHEAAVARREAANQAQQQRQTEAAGLVAGYPSRATGLAALEVPLTAWRGFTSLASHLPGSAGDRMAEMNREADTMQDALTEMGSQMLGSDAAQPAQAAALEGDAGVLAATVGQAQASGGELQTSAEGAAGLQSANEAALAEARRRAGAAAQREGQLADAAAEREQRADTLAEQLQQWAQQHAAQRQQAIAATTERLQAEGHAVTGSTAR